MKRARECKNWGVGLTFHQSRGGGGGNESVRRKSRERPSRQEVACRGAVR